MLEVSLNLNKIALGPLAACRRARPLLGTIVDVAVRAENEAVAALAVSRAMAAVARAQALLSFHDPGSDVSRINRSAPGAEVQIHPWTRRVLRRALEIARLSEGAFDVTAGAPLVRWGVLPGDAVEDDGATFRDLELGPGGVRRLRPLLVDLGGIAKGFAVDVAVAAARRLPVAQVVVDAGGDLRIAGLPARIGLRDPGRGGGIAGVLEMADAAIATSSIQRSLSRRGRWVSHLVDPRTRRPHLGRASVSVLARSCMEADALTKAVLLGDGARLLRRRRARAIVIYPGGRSVELPVAAR